MRGSRLIHTHTEHNHTCGEIDDRAFIVTTHQHVYAFCQWFRLPPGSLTGKVAISGFGIGLRVGMVILALDFGV